MMTVVQALWEDKDGNDHVTPGKLEDTSDGGASIRVKELIDAGSKLILRWHGGQFSGTVRYCHRLGKEYVLGIQRDPAKP